MYTFDSRVRYSETDESGFLSIAGIVDYFQDVSTFQSEALGLGVEYLHGHNMVWVMSAWQIIIHRYPSLGENIVAGTFPYAFRSLWECGIFSWIRRTGSGWQRRIPYGR